MIVESYYYTEALKTRSFDHLKTVRSIKKREVENCLWQMRQDLYLFAQSKVVIEAMQDFNRSFHNIKASDLPATYKERLKTYYFSEFKQHVNSPDKDTINFLSLIPTEPTSILLQTQYLIGNKSPFKPLEYHAVHDRYHAQLSEFLAVHGYYDLFLIDDKTGYVVYSVNKETDFATSLLTGAYANSNLGKLFRQIRYSGVSNQTILCDFERYLPSYLAPASFMAVPVFRDGKKEGTLILQLPVDKIDAITTNKKVWREEGLGETGESYIIGKDCKFRTNSRFIIESPKRFFETMERSGYDTSLLSQMKFYNTTILFPFHCSEVLMKSSAGQTGLDIIKDYRGVEVLSAYTNLDIPDVNWSLLSEMDASEAFYYISIYKNRAFVIATCIMLVLLISITFVSRSIYGPINELAHGARELGNGNMDVRVTVNTRDELKSLADSFNLAVISLKQSQDEIIEKNLLLQSQKQEIQKQSESLSRLNEEMMEVNTHLDQKVAERTAELNRQNKKLLEYSFINSHKLRAPVSTMLGLIYLIKITPSIEEKLKCMELLEKTAVDLDKIIHEIKNILKEAEFKEKF